MNKSILFLALSIIMLTITTMIHTFQIYQLRQEVENQKGINNSMIHLDEDIINYIKNK